MAQLQWRDVVMIGPLEMQIAFLSICDKSHAWNLLNICERIFMKLLVSFVYFIFLYICKRLHCQHQYEFLKDFSVARVAMQSAHPTSLIIIAQV